MADPLGYFISFRTYGTWLPGDARGAVDRRHNQYDTAKMEADLLMEYEHVRRMGGEPMILSADARTVVDAAVREVCAYRKWFIHALNVRTNHVHAVIMARHHSPERVMHDFKAYGTRALVDAGFVARGTRVWSRHGSTPWLWTTEQLAGAIQYVREAQD